MVSTSHEFVCLLGVFAEFDELQEEKGLLFGEISELFFAATRIVSLDVYQLEQFGGVAECDGNWLGFCQVLLLVLSLRSCILILM